jgi:hypothetical protein
VLVGLVAVAATPFGAARLTAFAEPAAQFYPTPNYPTPTATPYSWYSPTQNPAVYGTPTPTPYGYNQCSGAAVQDPNTPCPNNQTQPNPYQNGQPPSNQYPNTQYPNTQYPNGQYPNNQNPGDGSSIQPGAIVPNAAGSPGPNGSDPCYGDEQITFAPEIPRVADEVLIAVTSAHPHPYGRLAGTEMTHFVRERPGQKGYVWEWTIMPTYPGQHEYTFYVDSTIPCQKIQLTISESLATKTPRPTKTPTPYGWNNNGNNNNSNNNDNNTNGGMPPSRDPSQFTFSGDAYNCSFFYSQGEAQRVLRANPSDPNRLDSEDGVEDGIACTTYHNWQYPNDADYNPVQRNGSGSVPYRDPNQFVNNGDAYNCNTFYSQGEAQRVLRTRPSDPNQLDTENGQARDGVACTSYSGWQYPNDVDFNPVSH